VEQQSSHAAPHKFLRPMSRRPHWRRPAQGLMAPPPTATAAPDRPRYVWWTPASHWRPIGDGARLDACVHLCRQERVALSRGQAQRT